GTEDLARLTLMSDGVTVYECTSTDEVVDLLAGGQGVFGIALGRIWKEVDGTLAELPAERAEKADRDDGPGTGANGQDALYLRRAMRPGGERRSMPAAEVANAACRLSAAAPRPAVLTRGARAPRNPHNLGLPSPVSVRAPEPHNLVLPLAVSIRALRTSTTL